MTIILISLEMVDWSYDAFTGVWTLANKAFYCLGPFEHTLNSASWPLVDALVMRRPSSFFETDMERKADQWQIPHPNSSPIPNPITLTLTVNSYPNPTKLTLTPKRLQAKT